MELRGRIGNIDLGSDERVDLTMEVKGVRIVIGHAMVDGSSFVACIDPRYEHVFTSKIDTPYSVEKE